MVPSPAVTEEIAPIPTFYDDFRLAAYHSVITPSGPAPIHWFIMAWNINGIRNAIKKGALRRILMTFRPTVICLGELKQRKDRLAKLSRKLLALMGEYGYHSYHFNTCDTKDTGYSGTAIMSQVSPECFVEGWAHDRNVPDDEGRVTTIVFKHLVVIQPYVPSSGLVRNFESKRRKFDWHMLLHVAALRKAHARPIMLIGDMNVCRRDTDIWDALDNRNALHGPGSSPSKGNPCGCSCREQAWWTHTHDSTPALPTGATTSPFGRLHTTAASAEAGDLIWRSSTLCSSPLPKVAT